MAVYSESVDGEGGSSAVAVVAPVVRGGGGGVGWKQRSEAGSRVRSVVLGDDGNGRGVDVQSLALCCSGGGRRCSRRRLRCDLGYKRMSNSCARVRGSD